MEVRKSKELYVLDYNDYLELKAKAEKYDESISSRKRGAKKANSKLTAEERSERAKKAVQARIKKYNQKTKD